MILNSKYIYIILLFCSFSLFGQKQKVWETEKDYLEYRKAEKYKGPNEWYGATPSDMKNVDYSPQNNQKPSLKPLQYNPQQIERDRQQRKKIDWNGQGNGATLDPRVERPDPIEFPDIDPPDIDAPDVDLPDWEWGSWEGFWRILLVIILIVGLFFLVYFILKNRKPANPTVKVDVEDKWNPEVVTKTELELRLEEAISNEDYRECIRIYFTFILKELIKKSWIQWKKEKTNHHYVLEMSKQKDAPEFKECVRIYDIVWYGDYQIDKDVYELLVPTLAKYYKKIETHDD